MESAEDTKTDTPKAGSGSGFSDGPEADESIVLVSAVSGQVGSKGAVEVSPQGRYLRFEEKLGSGQYKDVYRAYDTQEGIEVAWNTVNIRMLPLEEKKRIMNEVRLLQNLNHMNLVAFHGSWLNKEQQQVIFVTEIVVNGSLKDFIAKVDLIRWKVVKRWARQILRGLSYLHGKDPPIIHRDLKCDNIFINGHTGDIRIGDLGLSTSSTRTNKTMSVLGTPEFMAPELYDESYNEKVDIYAFGMCLLEMITKERPYAECQNAAQIYKKVVSRTPPAALKRIDSEAARNFITLCIDYEPANRPSSEELLRHPFLEPNEEQDNAQVLLLPGEEDGTYTQAGDFHTLANESTASSLDPSFQPSATHPAQKGTPSLTTILETGGSNAPSGAGGGAALADEEDDTSNLPLPDGGVDIQASDTADDKSNLPGSPEGASNSEISRNKFPSADHEELLRAMPPDESNMKDLNLPEGRIERDSTNMRGVDHAVLLAQAQAQHAGQYHNENGAISFPPPAMASNSSGDTLSPQSSTSVPMLPTNAVGTVAPEPDWNLSRSRSLSPPSERRTSNSSHIGSPLPPQVGITIGGEARANQHQKSSSGLPPSSLSMADDGVDEANAHFFSSPGALISSVTAAEASGAAVNDPVQAIANADTLEGSATHIKYASSQGTEKDVMRLVMHAQVDGRLQEVEFDFNLEHDRANEVAAEMVEELQLPKDELEPIIRTIMGLAEHARSRIAQQAISTGHAANQGQPLQAYGVPDEPVREVVENGALDMMALGAGLPPVTGLHGHAQVTEYDFNLNAGIQDLAFEGVAQTEGGDDQDCGQQALQGNSLTYGEESDPDDMEEDEEYEQAKELHEKKMRQARKAYDARQQKLLIAINNCVEENRRQQEKFRRTYEGFEQKKKMMAVEFERRVDTLSLEWKDIESRHREQRKAYREIKEQSAAIAQSAEAGHNAASLNQHAMNPSDQVFDGL